MHTIEAISTLTLAQVTGRMQAANRRIREAADSIVERHYQRGVAPVCPSDVDVVPMPAAPQPSPETLRGVHTTYSDRSLIGYTHRGVGSDLAARASAGAETLVAAIRGLDALADTMERLDREYRDATAAAIATHASAQADATRILVGLVSQSGDARG